ncbi:pyruvate/2-oxoglutarate dehydrogenase complex, dihydrolipoamide acyltransferase (E2) component [Microbacterium testaceum StLB037]|uniref:Pyruvate/2-oxoglutarate dehydrogenase complex, dihydrolipoamide acyltransferase (E2) component n=1 Tax=Microbacterium testaceum (strain StLB037) TaxID=979556 RepID=E8NGR7_MICTS|nr:hypothetical protein [Microbacterium testaceum]BAJ75366.1 pyruvate/2-oxoglutarate dehydrogenase complex, dihydrolipoamide acyltransferase (E2) component [Microbacterium testaceum StLB037]
MTDDDLGRVLRSWDPARTPPDAPLPLAAERRLREILAASPAGIPRRRRSRRAVLLGAVAASVAAILAITVGVWGFPAPPAAALTPAPLTYTSIAADAPDVLGAAQARLAADRGPQAPERRSLSLGWYFSVTVGDPAATVFRREWVDLRWNADLSGSIVTTVAEATDAAGDTVPADDPAPGTVVGDLSFVRGQFAPTVREAPPATADALDAVLRTSTGAGDTLSAGDAIVGIRTLLGEWTLTDAHESALLAVVASTPDARVLGETTDRLGRPTIGIGGVPSGLPGTDMTLLVSTETGRILGVESTLRDDSSDLGLPAGSVTDYTLWGVEARRAAEG